MRIKNIVLSIIALATIALPISAHSTETSLSLLAGEGLTSGALFPNSTTGNTTGFSHHGFLMGFEYGQTFGDAPLEWNGSLYTDDVVMLGLGINLPIFRVTAKVGYGISNSTYYPEAGTTNAVSSNYGFLYGAGAEIKLTDDFGISANYISNKSYLGGITLHW